MSIRRLAAALAILVPLGVGVGAQRGAPPPLSTGGAPGQTRQTVTPAARKSFIQDLARDEDPATILGLTAFLQDPDNLVRREAANALAQRLVGAGPEFNSTIKTVRDTIMARLGVETDFEEAGRMMLRALGEMPEDGVTNVKGYLLENARARSPENMARRLGAAEGLEALIRQGARLEWREQTALEELAVPTVRSGAPSSPFLPALQALQAAGGADPNTIIAVARYHCRDSPTCGWQFRRIAAQMIDVANDAFDDVLRELVEDIAFQVRLETILAYSKRIAIKNDCQVIVDAFDDQMPIVAATAFDVVDARCSNKEQILERLKRESADLLDGDKKDAWFLPLHAFMALARLAPEDGKNLLPGIAGHPRWTVRAAAARTAGALKVEAVALHLAGDAEPKVRTDALTALRQVNSAQLEKIARQEFDRLETRGESIKLPDVGSLWAAASALKGHVEYDDFEMFLKVLKMPETNRMARVAALERIQEIATPNELGISPLKDHVREIEPYVNDSDGVVGLAAGETMAMITGRRPVPRPSRPTAVFPLPTFSRSTEILITMAKGDQIVIDLDGTEAPATVSRVLARIADAGDGYRGTTFHRLMPNMLLQGGSRDGSDWSATPCEANARARYVRLPTNRGSTTVMFSNHCSFWKDEFNPLRHERGAVALATNGPNTGIGQFFIDLVDIPAFNHQYTVIGKVACAKPARALPLITDDPVDLIEHFTEGEEIVRVEVPVPPVDRKRFICGEN